MDVVAEPAQLLADGHHRVDVAAAVPRDEQHPAHGGMVGLRVTGRRPPDRLDGMDTADTPRTFVVGGGLAGLTAAATLAQAGRPVTLLEGTGHLGGRARTRRRDGFGLNLGPHAVYQRRRRLRRAAPPRHHAGGSLAEHPAGVGPCRGRRAFGPRIPRPRRAPAHQAAPAPHRSRRGRRAGARRDIGASSGSTPSWRIRPLAASPRRSCARRRTWPISTASTPERRPTSCGRRRRA